MAVPTNPSQTVLDTCTDMRIYMMMCSGLKIRLKLVDSEWTGNEIFKYMSL